MDKELAKSIPISEILGKLNCHPTRVTGNKALYSSPLRKENTPSFYVYRKTNSWYDYGEAAGGDLIAFARHYLKSCNEADTLPDALRWIKNMAGDNYTIYALSVDTDPHVEDDPVLILKSKKVIQHLALVQYLDKRGIGLRLAQRHLMEVQVHNKETKRTFSPLDSQMKMVVTKFVTLFSKDPSNRRLSPLFAAKNRSRRAFICLKVLWITCPQYMI